VKNVSMIIASLLVMLTACSGANQPAPAPASTPVAQPAPNPTPTPATTGGKRYEVVKQDSKASYRVTELLAGATLRNEAVGTTSEVKGELVLDAQNKVQSTGFTVDLRSLTSDRGPRDIYIRTNGLESNLYPNATFTITEVKGSPTFSGSSPETFELVGKMKVRTTERTVTWAVTSTVQGQTIKWSAVLSTKMTDWGISPPVLLVRSVAEIEDAFKIEVVLLFAPA